MNRKVGQISLSFLLTFLTQGIFVSAVSKFFGTNSSGASIELAKQSDVESLKSSVSNGKSLIASAITDKGVSTAATATFQTMANNIKNIKTTIVQEIAGYKYVSKYISSLYHGNSVEYTVQELFGERVTIKLAIFYYPGRQRGYYCRSVYSSSRDGIRGYDASNNPYMTYNESSKTFIFYGGNAGSGYLEAFGD